MYTQKNEKQPVDKYQEMLRELIDRVEAAHFRTDEDTGAVENVMLIWNIVRQEAGLSRLRMAQLPTWCEGHKCYHTGGVCKIKEAKAV